MPPRPLALLPFLALLLLAPAAPAATISLERMVEREAGQEYVFGRIVIAAAPGEASTMVIGYEPGTTTPDAVTVADTSAPLNAGTGCTAAGAGVVRCQDPEARGIVEIAADLGDLADQAVYSAAAQGPYVVIDGGPGDDRLDGLRADLQGGDGNDLLTGGAGGERLIGGAGDDRLEAADGGDYLDGGPGDDVVLGGAGSDILLGGGSVGDPAPAGRDRLDGGAGDDALSDEDELGTSRSIGADTLMGGPGIDHLQSYLLRTAPVEVDLTRTGGQGAPGEDDTVKGFEDVSGGAGADTLIGDDGPNRLDGERGRDVVLGGGGNDRIASGVNPREDHPNAAARHYGPDRVSGDAGDDRIETLPALESSVGCGTGADRVVLVGSASDEAPSSLGPLVGGDCESLTMSGARRARAVSLDPVPTRVGRDRLRFRLTRSRCCAQLLRVERARRGARTIASARIRSRMVDLRVGRRVLETRDGRPVTLRGKITGVAANPFVWRFRTGE